MTSDRNLRGWLFTIAHRKVIDQARSRARRALPVAETPDIGVHDADGTDQTLWTAVARLPVKQRSAVVQRYLLDRPYEWVPVDLTSGETRSEAFRAINPNGKIPVLQLEDGTNLWESNAILNYLADGSTFLPSDPRLRTQVLQWQFFEQYSHEPHIAVARFWVAYAKHYDAGALAAKQEAGYRTLDAMEAHLREEPYFVGGRYSLADISLYAYTHVAEEGGFDLGRYPAVTAWLDRVVGQPGHVPISA